MSTDHTSRRRILLIVSLCVVGSVAVTPMPFAQGSSAAQPMPWLDVAGEPLPFQSDGDIREALLAASVKNRKEAQSESLDGYEMLLLEHQQAQFYALFLSSGKGASLELATYDLGQLLGLENIPPVVERKVGDAQGVVQIWRGRAGNEQELEQQGILIPPNPKDFKRQHQTLMLLDKLIANPSRSPETVLVDPGWKIWGVGYAHAFQATSEIDNPIELTKCDRTVWQRMKSLDKATLKQHMQPYLAKKQVTQLVARHRKLVKHIHDMISIYGEKIVLFGPAPST